MAESPRIHRNGYTRCHSAPQSRRGIRRADGKTRHTSAGDPSTSAGGHGGHLTRARSTSAHPRRTVSASKPNSVAHHLGVMTSAGVASRARAPCCITSMRSLWAAAQLRSCAAKRTVQPVRSTTSRRSARELLDVREVERGQRLVEQDQARRAGEDAREEDALALAAAHLVEVAVGEMRGVAERERARGLLPVARRSPRRSGRGTARGRRRRRRRRASERRDRGPAADSRRGCAYSFAGHCGERLPSNEHFARVRREHARERA